MANNPEEAINQLLASVDGDQPWNRIRGKRNEQGKLVKGEPDDAWQAFMHYRNMQYFPEINEGGPRRLVMVAERMNESISLLHRWSSEWNWPARVQAFDRVMIPKQAEEEAWQYQEFQKRVARQARTIANKGLRTLKQNAAGIENARDQL